MFLACKVNNEEIRKDYIIIKVLKDWMNEVFV